MLPPQRRILPRLLPRPQMRSSSCAPPARFARPCAGFAPSALAPTEPRGVPAGREVPPCPGHAPPKGSWAQEARRDLGRVPRGGGRGLSGGRRETISVSRAPRPSSPAGGAEEGEGRARIRCPVRPRVGVPRGALERGRGPGPADDRAGGTRSALAGQDPPAEGDISPRPKTPSTNTAET